jgi:hypothetical protein
MAEAAVTTSETPITPVQSGNASSDEALGAIYDRAMADRSEDASDAVAHEAEATATRDERGRFVKQSPAEASPQEGEAIGEGAASSVSERQAAPSGLPTAWRLDMADIWEDVKPEHRERLGKWSQEINTKLSDMGRKVSAYSEVQSVFDDMLQSYPERFNGPNGMKPMEAVKFLYQVQKDMDARPVETLLEIASRYNAVPELAKALGMGGDQASQVQTLQGTIQQLEARLASLVSPETINDHISRAMSEREVTSAVERFKAEKPFFDDVEGVLPQFIDIARANEPEADPMHLLATAYDMAVNAIPAVREKAQAAHRAAVQPDARAAAAKKAASINVKSTAATKSKPRSQEEAMGEAWDRLMAS